MPGAAYSFRTPATLTFYSSYVNIYLMSNHNRHPRQADWLPFASILATAATLAAIATSSDSQKEKLSQAPRQAVAKKAGSLSLANTKLGVMPGPKFTPGPSTAENQIATQKQEAFDKGIDELLASKELQKLPEQIEAFHSKNNMTFLRYRTKGDNAPDGRPYKRILSQSAMGPQGDKTPGYSFNIDYVDNTDGTRSFGLINYIRFNMDGTDKISQSMNGFQTLNTLELVYDPSTETWSAAYTDKAKGWNTDLQIDPSPNLPHVSAEIAQMEALLSDK